MTDPDLIEIRDLCRDLADDRTGPDCHGLVFRINKWLHVDIRTRTNSSGLRLCTAGRAAARNRDRSFKLTGRTSVATRIAKCARRITEETRAQSN